jgi:hypothetical protein
VSEANSGSNLSFREQPGSTARTLLRLESKPPQTRPIDDDRGIPKAKTNKAMNPASGPATPAEGRVRLETAHQKFAEACRQTASHGERMRTTIFGAVPVEDYVRFMELHTRHHGKQMADA